jgi:hypothetical protein
VARIPNIFEQVFRSGDAMTGVAHTGVGGGDGAGGKSQTPDGHIFRQLAGNALHVDGLQGAIDGGLLPLEGSVGDTRTAYLKLISIYVFAHGATSIKVLLVDTDGFEHEVGTSTTEKLVDDLLNDFMILPGWKLKVTADSIGANGAKIVAATDLWFHPAPFHQPQV